MSFGYMSVSELALHPEKGYLLQAMSAIIAIGGSRIFYIFGGGFTFEFEKLRLKREKVFLYLIFAGALLLTVFLLQRRNNFMDMFFMTVAVIFLLYYAIRREKSRD